MSHILATVLVSLTLPAVALAIIALMERANRERQVDSRKPLTDHNVVPASSEEVADVPQRPYRERAG